MESDRKSYESGGRESQSVEAGLGGTWQRQFQMADGKDGGGTNGHLEVISRNSLGKKTP